MSPIFVFVGLAVPVPFVSQKFWPATVTTGAHVIKKDHVVNNLQLTSLQSCLQELLTTEASVIIVSTKRPHIIRATLLQFVVI